MKKKKLKLKTSIILLINFILIITSFIINDANDIKNLSINLIISVIYLIILYNTNIIYKRIMKRS